MPSIPGYSSFDPQESTADEAALAAEAEALEANSGRIVGRGDNLVSDMRSTAVDFSEIVSDPLLREAGNSTEAYLAAMQGASWGAMVTGKWASDVETYKRKREELIEEWEEAVDDDFGIDRAALGAEIGENSPSLGTDAIDRRVDNAVAEAGQEKLTEMNGQADTAWEEYKDNAAEAGRMLTAGPNPEDLRILTGGGAASWMAYNLWGTDAAIPVTGSDGRDLGEALAEAMANGEDLTPELRAQLEMVYAIAERAQELQGVDGAELSPGELAFLEEFYGYMDSANGQDPRPGGINPDGTPLYFVGDWAYESESMSDADKRLVMTALGGGLLALSDESVGGGFDRLPPHLQASLDYQNGIDPSRALAPDAAAVLTGLSPLFGGVLTDSDLSGLEGGREFSSALTMAVADHFNPHNTANTAAVFDLESDVDELLGISTRNHDANADVLTGRYQHDQYGEDTPEFVLRSMFGYQWEDGGAAASGLIDWIAEDTFSDDPDEAERAAEAAFALFTTMTDRETSEHWEDSAYHFFTDGYGSIGGDPAASLGMANPEIARTLGDVTFSQIAVFGADTPGGKGNEFDWDDDPENRVYYLDENTRVSVFELVMSDQEAADTLGSRLYALVMADAGTMHDWEGLSEGERLATEHGRLLGLLDAGHSNLVADTTPDVETGPGDGITTGADDARHAAWARGAASILKEAGGELYSKIPGLETLGTAGKVIIKNILEVPKWGIPLGQAEGWWWDGPPEGSGSESAATGQRYDVLNFNISHSAVDGMINDPESGVTVEDVARAAERRGLDPDQVVNGDRLVDPDRTLDDVGYSDVAQVYRDVLEEHGLYDDYENYRDVLTPQRNDTTSENSGGN